MSDRIPGDRYAIIIGAMKCGTSSLYSYLRDHPEICPCITKEPEFFSENQRHGVQVTNYSELWTFDHSIHKYALEASTGYTKCPLEPNVPRNIFDYGIRPKLIYIIRNPFDRISSHFNFMKNHRSWKQNITDMHLISTSNYFIQLEQYRKYFSLDNILILDFNELRDNPTLLLQKIYKFLGLSHNYFPKEYKVKNQTQAKSNFEKNLRSLKFFTPFYDSIPKPLRRLGKTLVLRVAPPEKRVLTNDEKEFIYNELKEDMANLHRLYGFDVGKWGFDV
jgi:Sulfotransferase domain